jgi:hypothetical protein
MPVRCDHPTRVSVSPFQVSSSWRWCRRGGSDRSSLGDLDRGKSIDVYIRRRSGSSRSDRSVSRSSARRNSSFGSGCWTGGGVGGGRRSSITSEPPLPRRQRAAERPMRGRNGRSTWPVRGRSRARAPPWPWLGGGASRPGGRRPPTRPAPTTVVAMPVPRRSSSAPGSQRQAAPVTLGGPTHGAHGAAVVHGSRQVSPAQVEWAVGPVASRWVQCAVRQGTSKRGGRSNWRLPGTLRRPPSSESHRRRPLLIPPRSHDPYPVVPVRNPRLLHDPGRSGAARSGERGAWASSR